MTDWRTLCPNPAPAPVTRAMRAVEDVAARLMREREQLTAAQAALTQAAADDRIAMAQTIREGGEPTSSEDKITAAKQAVETAERRVEAGQLAHGDAQIALGDACRAARGKWSEKAADDLVRSRERGLEALEALEQAMRDMTSAISVAAWLAPNGGLDNAKPCRVGLLPTLAASRSASANGDPIHSEAVLSWLRAQLEPARPPADVVHHSRDQWPATGPAIVGI